LKITTTGANTSWVAIREVAETSVTTVGST
jgi:hypothetical protein